MSLMLVLLSLAASSQEPRAQELELAAEFWPPFVDHSGQTRTALSLVETALKRAGVPHRITVLDGMASMEVVSDGTFSGSASVWRVKSREKTLLFSEPYLENRLVLIAKRGRPVGLDTPEDFDGATLAVVDHFAYGVSKPPEGLRVVLGPSITSNLEAVARGEVDYTIVDELVMRHVLRANPAAVGLFEVGTEPVVRRGLHLALRKDHPGAAAILRRFNREIRKMLTDGSYNRALGMDWLLVDATGNSPAKWVTDRAKAGKKPPHLSYVVRYGSGESLSGGFVVNGREYESWDAIPRQLKTEPVDRCTDENACAVSQAWSLSL